MRSSIQRAAELVALKKLISVLVAVCAVLIGSSTAWSGPLHDAVIDGDVDEVKRLIAQGADVNEEDFAAGLPLHLAISEAHKTIAELLIARGADVNAEDFELGTPLHIVASEGDVDMAELLIANGADVDATDSEGSTPLHIAAGLGHLAVVDFLVNSGADPDVVNDNGIIPLQAAAEEGEADVIEALIAGGAKVPTIESVSRLLTTASVDDGERVAQACTECHTVEKGGPNVYGPNLWGIVGSPKAVREGFNYSAALIEVGGVWSYEDLNAYLANPALFAPGTSMLIDPLEDAADRANLIAYLRQNSDDPPALPKQ